MGSAAVGIDLGTTNSVIAVSQQGKPRVLPTEDGAALVPSVVSFHPNGQSLVGAAARARRGTDPAQTVFSVKRLLGRPFHSEEVRRARSRFAFELSEGPDAAVLVRTRVGEVSLPEISALILRELRRVGEVTLGSKVERAVVTVPANFNELQRTATKIAGQIADLEVIRILNEPTAAALAYGYGRGARERVVVYDFGGGTFDVTLLELSGNVFEVLATAGDTFLGGDDLDLLVAENLADGLLRTHRIDARQDLRTFELLRAAAEQAKIELSTAETTTIRVPEVGYGPGGVALEFRTRITRGEIERLAAPLVARTLDVCAEALKLAGLGATDFQNVILVGGTSRMPAVRSQVARFFERPPLTTLPPEEVVAMGASILAEALTAPRRPRAAAAPSLTATVVGPPPAPATAPASASASGEPATDPAANTSPLGGANPLRGTTQPGLGTRAGGGVPVSAGRAGAAPPGPMPAVARTQTNPGFGPVSNVPAASSDELSWNEPAVRPATAAARSALDSLDEPGSDPLRARPMSQPLPRGPMPNVPPGLDIPSTSFAPAPPGPTPPSAFWSPPGGTPERSAAGTTSPVAGGGPAALPPATHTKSSLPPAAASPAVPAVPAVPAAAGPRLTVSGLGFPAVNPAASAAAPPVLLDVTPHSLGVETVAGMCQVIIARNATIPVEQTREFATAYDDQDRVRIRIAQGESRRIAENQPLGELELSGLPRARRGEVKIAVTFELDADGTLQVRAREVATGRETAARLALLAVPTADVAAAMAQRQRAPA